MPEKNEQFEKLATQAWSYGFFGGLQQRGYGSLADEPEEAIKAAEALSDFKKEAAEELEPKIKKSALQVCKELGKAVE